ncbi:G-protein coupled receptor 1 [Phlyctema vagabunda]|uniref:G-protein coupled receptor 1 n=1 Tax=Phlyctema vagabunda TaxID=108571 RepID=A0ABR4PK38_9HELO
MERLFGRTTLSAPSSPSEIHTLSIVITIVAISSILGAGWIIISFALFKPLRTFRHQLILGLAMSDFLMAVNFLSASTHQLDGHSLKAPSEKHFCDFNGFMIQLFVVQTDYWVLTIAICTYMILADLNHPATWIENHKVIIWVLPWLLSIFSAALGLGLVGYGSIGAWCWFTSDRIRLLVNFIPRWLIVIVMVFLYVRLYFLIRKAQKTFVSVDDQEVGSWQTESSALTTMPPANSKRQSRRMTQVSFDPVEGDGYLGLPVTNVRIGGSSASPRLRSISYKMMTYPLVYIMIWILPTSIRLYQTITGNKAPFVVGTIDKVRSFSTADAWHAKQDELQ